MDFQSAISNAKKSLISHRETISVLLIIAIFLSYAFVGFSYPWTNHYSFSTCELAIPALLHLEKGFSSTKLGSLLVSNYNTEKKLGYNYHRPIGTTLLITLSFAIFGISEASARLVGIMINLLGIVFFYKLIRLYYGPKPAFWAGLFYVTTPILFLYRSFTTVDLNHLPATTMVLYFYTKWLNKNSKKNLTLLLGTYMLFTLGDWSCYLIAGALLTHYYLFKSHNRQKDKRLGLIVICAVIMFCLFFVHVSILKQSEYGTTKLGKSSVKSGFMKRTGMGHLLKDGVTLKEISGFYKQKTIQILKATIKRISWGYSNTGLMILSAYLLILLIDIKNSENLKKDILPLIVFLTYFIYTILFNNLFLVHNILILKHLPAISFMSAVIIHRTSKSKLMQKKNVKTLGSILLILATGFHISSSTKTAEKIYENDFQTNPLYEFLHQNKEDVIISFKKPAWMKMQLGYYYQERDVRRISTKKAFDKLISTQENYKYYISYNEAPPGKTLMEYLNKLPTQSIKVKIRNRKFNFKIHTLPEK